MNKTPLTSTILAALLVAAAWIGASRAAPASSRDGTLTSAIADPTRPDTDRNRDAARRPLETLRFVGIKADDAVADFNAGAGYFTRLFSDVVGAQGRVYAIAPQEIQSEMAKSTALLRTDATARPNVTIVAATALDSLRLPRKLDLFFISQNYHDLHNSYFGPMNMATFNKAVFAALKPGGRYVVLDHSAAPDAAAEVTETLHRIDPAVVRREVEAAGFRFEGVSRILANPGDSRRLKVFDPSIQGHTDQFILKFRKPG